MSFNISHKAKDDIEKIWLYTYENWSIEQANRYVQLIFDEITFLSVNPLSGKDIGYIRKSYRCSKVKSHLIFYMYSPKKTSIEIIRVLHERMDIESRISG